MEFIVYALIPLVTVLWIFAFEIPLFSKLFICIMMIFPTILVSTGIIHILNKMLIKLKIKKDNL